MKGEVWKQWSVIRKRNGTSIFDSIIRIATKLSYNQTCVPTKIITDFQSRSLDRNLKLATVIVVKVTPHVISVEPTQTLIWARPHSHSPCNRNPINHNKTVKLVPATQSLYNYWDYCNCNDVAWDACGIIACCLTFQTRT